MLAKHYHYLLAILSLSNVVVGNVSSYRGSSLTWLVNETDEHYFPRNLTSPETKILIKFTTAWVATNSTNGCYNKLEPNDCRGPQKQPVNMFFGTSISSQPSFHQALMSYFYCEKPNASAASALHIGYSDFTAVVPHKYYYRLQYSGCCWASSLQPYSSSSWHLETIISLSTRPGSNKLNNPPQLQYMPSITVRQDETKIIRIPVFDKDGDVIKCRWAVSASEGGVMYNSRIGVLNQNICSLEIIANSLKTGSYGLTMIAEDFLPSDKKNSLSRISLQFTVTVTAQISETRVINCTYRNKKTVRMASMLGSKIVLSSSTSQVQNMSSNSSRCVVFKTVKYPGGLVTHNVCGSSKAIGGTVYCSMNYMRIDLDRSQYNKSLYSSISLLSTSCQASYSPSYISAGTILGGCGSTARILNGQIVYVNEVIMKAKSFDGLIVRNPDISIKYYCSYPVNSVQSLNAFKLVTEVNAREPGFGDFKLDLDMHSNSFYNSKYNKFPVGVQLTDLLYFEASTTASDKFVLLIDQCFSTPAKDRYHPDKRLFINERCGTRNDVKFYSTTRAKQRFSIKASELLKNRTEAYVHCLLFLCFHTATDNRCKSGCTGNNLQRTARNIVNNSVISRPSDASNLYLVEIGAVQKEADQPNKPGGNHGTRTVLKMKILLLLVTFANAFTLWIG